VRRPARAWESGGRMAKTRYNNSPVGSIVIAPSSSFLLRLEAIPIKGRIAEGQKTIRKLGQIVNKQKELPCKTRRVIPGSWANTITCDRLCQNGKYLSRVLFIRPAGKWCRARRVSKLPSRNAIPRVSILPKKARPAYRSYLF
jgi:hypothetical protein